MIKKLIARSHNVFIIIQSPNLVEVREWFRKLSPPLEEIFFADIKGRCDGEAIAFAVLIGFKTTKEMESTLSIIAKQINDQGWKYEYMKVNWINIEPFKAATGTKRKIGTDGKISFKNKDYYISQKLKGKLVDISISDDSLRVFHEGDLLKVIPIRR